MLLTLTFEVPLESPRHRETCGVFLTYSAHLGSRVFSFPVLGVQDHVLLVPSWWPAPSRPGNPGRTPTTFPLTQPENANEIPAHHASTSSIFLSASLSKSLFLLYFLYSFPAFKLFLIILYRNNPESSHIWSLWSCRKGHWNKSTPAGILCEMRAICLSECPSFGQSSSPMWLGFLRVEATFAKSKEKEMYVSPEFSWLWSKDKPFR